MRNVTGFLGSPPTPPPRPADEAELIAPWRHLGAGGPTRCASNVRNDVDTKNPLTSVCRVILVSNLVMTKSITFDFALFSEMCAKSVLCDVTKGTDPSQPGANSDLLSQSNKTLVFN